MESAPLRRALRGVGRPEKPEQFSGRAGLILKASRRTVSPTARVAVVLAISTDFGGEVRGVGIMGGRRLSAGRFPRRRAARRAPVRTSRGRGSTRPGARAA